MPLASISAPFAQPPARAAPSAPCVQVSSSLLGQLLVDVTGSLYVLFFISAAATAVACVLALGLPSPRPKSTELIAAGWNRAGLLNSEAWSSVQCRAISSSDPESVPTAVGRADRVV